MFCERQEQNLYKDSRLLGCGSMSTGFDPHDGRQVAPQKV